MQFKQTNNFKTLLLEPDAEDTLTLVFSDINETILTPEAGFVYRLQQCDDFLNEVKKDFPPTIYEKILKEIDKKYYTSYLRLVEPGVTKEVIDQLKKRKNTFVFGCTSCGKNHPHIQTVVDHMNNKLDLDFSDCRLEFQELSVKNGIILTGSYNKADSLKVFIDGFVKDIQTKPAFDIKKIHIVFIDNTLKKCSHVESDLKDISVEGIEEITFSVIHYHLVDEIDKHKEMLYDFGKIVGKILSKSKQY